MSNRPAESKLSTAAHVEAPNSEEPVTDYSAKAQNKTKFSHYFRIFTYSTWTDRLVLGAAILGEIGSVTVHWIDACWLNPRRFL